MFVFFLCFSEAEESRASPVKPQTSLRSRALGVLKEKRLVLAESPSTIVGMTLAVDPIRAGTPKLETMTLVRADGNHVGLSLALNPRANPCQADPTESALASFRGRCERLAKSNEHLIPSRHVRFSVLS